MVGIKKLEKGFTLIELLTVIVILSLLILVALPNVLKAFLNARKDAFIIEAKEIYSQSKETYIKESLKGKKIGVIDSEGNNKLNLDNAKDLGYCLILDNNGNVQDMIVYNNMFYVSVDNPIVEIEGLSRDDIKEEIPEDFLCDDLDPNKRYSVSFDSNGGEEPSFLKNNDLINGEQYGNLPITMWEEHNFIGWFTDKIIGNQIVETSIFNRKDKIDTLYAHWIQIKYNVTLDANGGNLPTTTFSIAKNEPYGALPVPTLSNYTFAGWFTEKNAGIEIKSDTLYNLSTDQTLYAHWTVNKYVVKFNSNGGNTPNIESINVTYGTNYGTLATVTRTNYKFMGWFTDSTNGTQITSTTLVKINSNHTLYAHWELEKDTKAPIIKINAVQTTYSLNSQAITGTITDEQDGVVSGNISYALTTSSVEPTSGWNNTTLSIVNFSDLLASENITYYVHAKDKEGNSSYSSIIISNIVWQDVASLILDSSSESITINRQTGKNIKEIVNIKSTSGSVSNSSYSGTYLNITGSGSYQNGTLTSMSATYLGTAKYYKGSPSCSSGVYDSSSGKCVLTSTKYYEKPINCTAKCNNGHPGASTGACAEGGGAAAAAVPSGCTSTKWVSGFNSSASCSGTYYYSDTVFYSCTTKTTSSPTYKNSSYYCDNGEVYSTSCYSCSVGYFSDGRCYFTSDPYYLLGANVTYYYQ